MKSKYAVFYYEHVLNKEPGVYDISFIRAPSKFYQGTEKETPWHHDQSYYPIDGFCMASIWMPVDPVPKDSSLKFVKGSHKWCQWFHPRKFESGKNYPIEKEYCMEKEFYDVPVDDIENGKYEVTKSIQKYQSQTV